MRFDFKKFFYLLSLFLSLVGIGLLLAYGLISNFRYGEYGSLDFIQYWTTNKLYLENKNPFDVSLIGPLQLSLGRKDILFCWNPPWTLTLLSSLLFFSFSTSAKIWYFFNILFFIKLENFQ